MLNIKEIALKVADSLRNKIDGISHMQSNQGLVAFAEALIAELAKQNEPVAFTNSAQLGYVTSGQHQDIPLAMWSINTSYSGADIPLYTFPPTAEQIAAKQLNNKRLREALKMVTNKVCWSVFTDSEEMQIEEALAQPSDTSALDSFVAEKVKEAVKEADDQILAAKNLLAIMHRDGGHHEFAVGFDQAIQDAMAVYYELTKRRELALDALRSCGVNDGLNGPTQYFDEELVGRAIKGSIE